MSTDKSNTSEILSVAMGRWGVAVAPRQLATLLGSCVGILLYERKLRLGGLAHIVLPDSRGVSDNPGKYVDTAVPAMLEEMRQLIPAGGAGGRLTAKLIGGAKMFQTSTESVSIGQANHEAAERLLSSLGITVMARDLGGESGRRVTVDLSTGVVTVRLPAGGSYEI